MVTTATAISGACTSNDRVHANAIEMSKIVAAHLPHFNRIASSRLGNIADAEDAVQDALLSAWQHLDQFKGRARMTTWLTAIVINATKTMTRKRRGKSDLTVNAQISGCKNSLGEMLADCRPDPEVEFGNAELERNAHNLSTHLSSSLRQVRQLRSVEGLSIRKTAKALGLTESAVKSRSARARAELRRLIARTREKAGAPWTATGRSTMK